MKYFIIHSKSGVKKKKIQAQMSAGVCEEWIPLKYKQQNYWMKPQIHQLLNSKC